MPTLSIFDFIHTAYDTYPASSVKVQFGNGYQFSSVASGADQIITTLKFAAMKYWLNMDGVPDATLGPKATCWPYRISTKKTQALEDVRLPASNQGTHVRSF